MPGLADTTAAEAPALNRHESVRKDYPAHRGRPAVTALEHIDLSVARGEIVGVIGRSGAGKSTLIRLVNGLEKPSAGRVLVDGADIAVLGETALGPARRTIGMVFQHFNLLASRTVFGNVALPLEIAGHRGKIVRERVEPLLERVGLTDKRDRYPAELSGGQKQRVGIARALANGPKILLSDEATSALDPETTAAILDLLAGIKRELDLTILLITHEMSVIRRIADRVAVIDGGRIVEQGPVAEVFAAPTHETTRSFLGSESGRRLPAWIADRLQPTPVEGGRAVLRIVFRGEHASTPVLSRLAREQNLDVNILSGSIERIADQPFGILHVALPGDHRALAHALGFLAGHELRTEVLGHVA
jgi:D-methionine transport system ATP-binding protein